MSSNFDLGFGTGEPSGLERPIQLAEALIERLRSQIDQTQRKRIDDAAEVINDFQQRIQLPQLDTLGAADIAIGELNNRVMTNLQGRVGAVVEAAAGAIRRSGCLKALPDDFPPVLQWPPGLDTKECNQFFKRIFTQCWAAFGKDDRFKDGCRRCAWRGALLECGWKPKQAAPVVAEPRPPVERPPQAPRPPEPQPEPPEGDLPPPEQPAPPVPMPGPGEPNEPKPPPPAEGDPNQIPGPGGPVETPTGDLPVPRPPGPPGPGPQQPRPPIPPPVPPHPPEPPLPAEQCFDNRGCQWPFVPAFDIDNQIVGCFQVNGPGPVGEGWRIVLDDADCPVWKQEAVTEETGACPNCWHFHGPTEDCPCGSVTPCGHVTERPPPPPIPPLPPPPPPTVPVPIPIPPAPTNDCQWIAWYAPDFERCYVKPVGEPKTNANDIALGCGRTPEEARRNAGDLCIPKGDEGTLVTVIVGGDFSHITGDQCALDRYLPGSPNSWQMDPRQDWIDLLELDVFRDPAKRKEYIDGAEGIIDTAGRYISMGFVSFLNDWVKPVFAEMMQSQACDNVENITATTMETFISFLANWVSPSLEKYQIPWKYRSNVACHYLFPDVQQATQAFINGSINQELYLNWVEMNGYCAEPWDRVREASQTRFSLGELLTLWRRGKMATGELPQRLREIGFMDDHEVEEAKELSRQLPSFSDIIRMMVRDVADEGPGGVVERFGLDDQFGDKFRGKLRDWAAQQGIEEDVAKAFWRAHWSWPGPQQLFQMLHRSQSLPAGDPRKIDLDDVRTALVSQDILPFYVDKLINLSFRPLTRVDARRAFEINTIDRNVVKKNFLDQGYDPDNAEILTKFTEEQKQRKLERNQDARDFEQGIIDEPMMRRRLAADGATPDTMKAIVDRALNKLTMESRNKCKDALRKRFLLGEFDANAARAQLMRLQFDVQVANIIVEGWECEFVARGKDPSTALLCKWLERGAINAAEFVRRTMRLGWRRNDAIRILIDCVSNINLKRAKQAEKLAKEDAREAARLQREIEQREKELQREQAKAEKAATAAQKARDKRERLLLIAAMRYAKQEEIELPDAQAEVKRLYRMLTADYEFKPDERVSVITQAVEKRPKKDPPTLETLVIQVAEALEDFAGISANGQGESSEDSAETTTAST